MTLKQCPFCKGVAEADSMQGYRAMRDGRVGNQCAVYCTSCDAHMSMCHADFPELSVDEMMAILTDAWNRRDQ